MEGGLGGPPVPAAIADVESVPSGDAPAEPVPVSGDAPAPASDLPAETIESQVISGDTPEILVGAIEPSVEIVTGEAEPEDEPIELEAGDSSGAPLADQEHIQETEPTPESSAAAGPVPSGEVGEASLAVEAASGSAIAPRGAVEFAAP